MPLHKGSSPQAQEANRLKLQEEFRKSGRIGNCKPKDKEHASRIIEAIVRNQSIKK